MRMAGRLIAGFMTINIVLLVVGLSLIFWQAEKGIRGVVRSGALATVGSRQDFTDLGDLIITRQSMELDGLTMPDGLEELLNRDDVKGIRRIGHLKDDQGTDSFFRRTQTIRYMLEIRVNEQTFQIIYAVGEKIRTFYTLLIALFIVEIVTIISDLIHGTRKIRMTLKPLYELAEAAQTLNKEVSALGTQTEDRQLKALAGVISSIDANQLDKRISVDSSQDELKGLAAAINDMLNRINDSYQSQVQFVSDASHELRTPISVIQGYVNLLDRWGKNDEKTMQESIDAIKSETQNMKELVEQLLFLARGDNETIQLQRERFDVCGVVDEIAREAQMIDASHHFEINLNSPVVIDADKQLIKQAIRILVDNSCKYTPEGETITLRVTTDQGNARITVQDNGIGIEPASLPLIFNRFYRSDESRSRGTGGSGLGLAIARWIIERHGAHFEILSRVHVGTRITIVMPTSQIIQE